MRLTAAVAVRRADWRSGKGGRTASWSSCLRARARCCCLRRICEGGTGPVATREAARTKKSRSHGAVSNTVRRRLLARGCIYQPGAVRQQHLVAHRPHEVHSVGCLLVPGSTSAAAAHQQQSAWSNSGLGRAVEARGAMIPAATSSGLLDSNSPKKSRVQQASLACAHRPPARPPNT